MLRSYKGLYSNTVYQTTYVNGQIQFSPVIFKSLQLIFFLAIFPLIVYLGTEV